MGIKGVSGRVRIPRTVKIRLGYKKPGENFPRDTDVFVGRSEDGVSKEILDAYGKGRIEGADGEAYNLGKSLRMLSYFEWDALSPQDNRELVVELLNRAWSHAKNRCFGDGGDEPGLASAADEEWAKEIQKVTHKKPVALDGGRFQVVCLGPKCPFWNTNSSKDKRATCHRELRLRARLLHPETNPEAPNYNKQLGWVEIASGSWNGMIDIQSGLQIMRSVAGRSAGIPFTLRRTPRTVFSDGKRLNKATLIVDYDHDEVIRFGYSDPKLALVRPAVQKELMEMRRQQLALARAEVDYDSVKDIVPQLPAATEPEPTSNDVASYPHDVVVDREQVVTEAGEAAGPGQLSDEQLNARLSQQERDQLKDLCGAKPKDDPQRQDSLAKFFEYVAAAHREFGTGQTPRDLTALTVRHALWIKEQVAAEQEARE